MADRRFFVNRGPFSIETVAKLAGATLGPGVDPARMLVDVAALETATGGEVTFFDNPRYLASFRATRAGACLVAPKYAGQVPSGTVALVTATPYKAYARVAAAFYPPPALRPGIHARATVDSTASLGADCQVDAGAVIEAGASIGARCWIGANAVVGANVVLGSDCRIGPLVSLSHCLVGDRVVFHAGARIGQDGFGFAPDPAGHVKVPQIGRVVIGDDCDIGANTTIDRGAGPDTVIGPGSWIDNLVQIGHNVQIGRGCIIVALAGVSGSTKLGDFVALGGQSGLAGHLRIGTGAQIAAQSGVMGDVPAGETWSGAPAVPIREHFRQIAQVQRLAREKGKKE